MQERKKIVSILIKVVVGIASTLIIWSKIKNDLTPQNIDLLFAYAFSGIGVLCFMGCLFLVPINWGIESFKWKLITQPIEQVSFKTALKSVYGGVCLGNLAPGRSTEFLAKIFFFKPENRSKITVLHFVNGLFQFSITILVGLFALIFKLNDFGKDYSWIAYAASGGGIFILLFLCFCIYKIEAILKFISKKISKENNTTDFKFSFSTKTLFTLFGFSVLRYCVFCSQLCLLLYLFYQNPFTPSLFISIALYFLITSIVPMISFLEAAIRSAIALVVFKNSGINNSHIALSVILLWFMNIVLPSMVGYYFLFRRNFNFKLSKQKS